MPANLENSVVDRGLEKVSFYSNHKERQRQRMFKLPSATAFISHASKVMLKILQARLQQYVNWELSNAQAGFRKGRGTRDQIANIHWVTEKSKGIPKIPCASASLTILKPLTVWLTTNCGKFLKDGNTRPPYLFPEKPVCRSRSSS